MLYPLSYEGRVQPTGDWSRGIKIRDITTTGREAQSLAFAFDVEHLRYVGRALAAIGAPFSTHIQAADTAPQPRSDSGGLQAPRDTLDLKGQSVHERGGCR